MGDIFHTNIQDLNDLRENGVGLIKRFRGGKVHHATKADLQWFKEDWEVFFETPVKLCDEYVTKNLDELIKRYPFLVTEWLVEWYDIQMDLPIKYTLSMPYYADWNLFFSFVYPLPPNIAIPFYRLVRRLDVKENILIKKQIVDDIWNNTDLRQKVVHGEGIPAVYTYYISYQQLRQRILTRNKAGYEGAQAELAAFKGTKQPEWYKEMSKLVREGYVFKELVGGEAVWTK